jgi:hypothetical protein
MIRCQFVLAGLMLAGCGRGNTPELGRVNGTVKLDGNPLPKAHVVFQPESGRPSVATTDDNGHYVLEYKPGVKGALVGKHKVSIRTFREKDPDAEDPAGHRGAAEKVPAKYNAATTLEREVSPGKNDPIDFDLESKGKIVNPDQEGRERQRESRDC